MLDLFVIALFCFVFYAKGKRAILAYQDRPQKWRAANAGERERLVREEAAWRTIGRLVGAGGLAIGAFAVASPGLAVMWAIVAWRIVAPIKQEIMDANSFRSTGDKNEPPYTR